MNKSFIIFIIVVTFSYFINVYAKNNFYICAIIRDVNDKYYDDASVEIQNAIDELVNERMNDIYTIINDNRDTYLLNNGKMDEILKELNSSTLKKRNLENKKLLFVNEKRSNYYSRSQTIYKRSLSLTEKDELIAIDSQLVSHICPIKNYYAIRVYLSDAILGKVESLPNIKYCEKTQMSKNDIYSNPDTSFTGSDNNYDISYTESENGSYPTDIPYAESENDLYPTNIPYTESENGSYPTDIPYTEPDKDSYYNPYYNPYPYANPYYYLQYAVKKTSGNYTYTNPDPYFDLQYVKKETNWDSVGVQEIDPETSNKYLLSHLSLISQSRYLKENTKEYDYNYYYPGSGGQGIDIYIIDDGLDTHYDDFDTYPGTDHERTVTCDSSFYGNRVIKPRTKHEREFCQANYSFIHGHSVAAAAGGKYVGAAKYANIHMLASSELNVDELNALDFIKAKGKPHKTVINISRSGGMDVHHTTQDKFEELTEYGFIFVVSAGNYGINRCFKDQLYNGFSTAIKVASSKSITNDNMDKVYMRATYSNFGSCIDIYAPGQTLFPVYNGKYELFGNRYNITTGTSLSAPLVSGVIATLMSEHPEIDYTFETMKELLLDLSLKDVITGIQSLDTPNRFLNNGKKIVYSPVNSYEGCGASSGYKKCPEGSCCTSTNQCFEIGKYGIMDHCLVEKGCQPNYGTCLSDKNFKPIKIYTAPLMTYNPVFPYNPKMMMPNTSFANFKPGNFTFTTTTATGASKSLPTTVASKMLPNTNGSKILPNTTKVLPIITTTTRALKTLPTFTATTNTTSTEIPKIMPFVIPEMKECGMIYGRCAQENPQNTAYITIGCCNKDGKCGLSTEDCSIDAGCQSRYGICLKNTLDENTSSIPSSTSPPPPPPPPPTNSTDTTDTTDSVIIDDEDKNRIGKPCGEGYGSCIVKRKYGYTYEHVSCCSKDGFCGLSDDHCGEGCQSEFGACYATSANQNIPIPLPSSENIPNTTPPVTPVTPVIPQPVSTMSITSLESTENIPIIENAPVIESIPINMESIPMITENIPITTTNVKYIQSTIYITTTSTTTITKSNNIIETSSSSTIV